jgi:hypothetical protein
MVDNVSLDLVHVQALSLIRRTDADAGSTNFGAPAYRGRQSDDVLWSLVSEARRHRVH